MNTLYLLLGSNLQNPEKQLLCATKFIKQSIGNIIRQSGLYQTAAWGNTKQPDFLNQIIIVQTNLDAQQTLQSIFIIEKKMGRIRTKKNAPRIIDIDILFFNKEIINKKNLNIPHLQIQNRKFVLVPLNQLSPNFKHPVLHKSIHQLLINCTDNLSVVRFKI